MHKFDFAAARKRREELASMYRCLKKQQLDDGTWSWWLLAQIEELDLEIQEAHLINAKKTVGQDGQMVETFANVVTPIIPAWFTSGKEDLLPTH